MLGRENKVSWTVIKAIKIAKGLPLQYVNDEQNNYIIYLADHGFLIHTVVQKSTPRNADQTDFEDNYQSGANVILYNNAYVYSGSGVAIGNTGDKLKVDAVSDGIPVKPFNNIVYKVTKLLNGSSDELSINGSVTPVNFDFTPASGETWYLEAIHLFLQDNGTTLADRFGSATALTNGLQILVKTLGTEYEIANVQHNMDLNLVFKESTTIPNTSGLFETSDIYIGQLRFAIPIILKNANSDYVRAKVRDNLTDADFIKMRAKVWRITT